MRFILFVSLTAFSGIVFLFSGYTKLYPVEPFEFSFVDMGVSNWYLAPFAARIFIGLEFFIGSLLLLNLFLKKFTYKLSIGLLILFTLYLIIQIITSGNNGNCGCFGQFLVMTPLQAIIKNVLMIILLVVLYKNHEGVDYQNFGKVLLIVSVCTSFSLPFVLNPVELDHAEAYLNRPEKNFRIDLEPLFENAKINIPPRTLSNGKHVIAFMSLRCPHCRIAAKKIRIIKERQPALSFYFVLNGKEKDIDDFFDDTQASNIPYCLLLEPHFVRLSGLNLPSIYLVHHSVVEHQVNYFDLSEDELKKWFEKK